MSVFWMIDRPSDSRSTKRALMGAITLLNKHEGPMPIVDREGEPALHAAVFCRPRHVVAEHCLFTALGINVDSWIELADKAITHTEDD